MSKAAELRRMEELRRLIHHHDRLYHVEARPDITDAEYDLLFRELRELEARHPDAVPPDSPTRRVGAPLAEGTGFRVVRHAVPMLSIDSLFTPDEVREFDARARKGLGLSGDQEIAWVVEPKYDGVSTSLLYENGAFVLGLTRGDGVQGEDITTNLRTIRTLPLRLQTGSPPRLLEVRGETILSRKSFTRLNRALEDEGELPFANPRNAVAGTLKRLDPAVVARRPLEFIAWGLGRVEGADWRTHWEVVTRLEEWGFRVSEQRERCTGPAAVIELHDRLEKEREELPYEMDGIVAKVDDLKAHDRLGATSRHARWQLAYKFTPRQATTRVREIRVQVGRTGALTPVAVLDPVNIGGVIVKRATLHNEGEAREKDVRVGDAVVVERAGDVIPEVVRVIVEQREGPSPPFEMPGTCPECGAQVVREGAFVLCPNISCPAQIKGRIVHLAGRRALDINRLGIKVVDQLMTEGLVREVADIFYLDRERLVALERWGERSADNLLEQIERARRVPFARLLFALGIRQVGEATARLLAERFPSLEELERASLEELQEVDGIGPEVAASIHDFFQTAENRRTVHRMIEAGLQVERPQPVGGPLAGKVFLFTGTLASMTRSRAQERVEALGGTAAEGLSARVSYLVAGEDPGAKLERARKLGVAVLTEAEFLELVKEGSKLEA